MMLNRNSQPDIKETLSPILRVLSQLGGKFSFTDDEGRQFVIMRQEEIQEIKKEKQLSLPAAPEKVHSADDVLEKINREIASWQMQDEEELAEANQEEDRQEDFHRSQEGVPMPPNINNSENKEEEPKRVRFEPLKGDLDPELQ
ncbi:MAG: hypothetical protein WDZ75_00805 [Candidatus Paceibacterota bacterium]